MARAAAIQMTSTAHVGANLDEARRRVGEASAGGAALCVLPENFALMARSRDQLLEAAERDGDGPIQRAMSEAARANGVWIVAGSVPLATESRARVRAACIVYDEQGRAVARYDKIHLFDVVLEDGERHAESRSIEPGTTVVAVDTPVGRLGLSICYDLRFPELYRALLDQGAQVFAVPAAFTAFTGRAHWETLVRARAIENSVYVIAAAQVGRHSEDRETYGHSMVVDPWGGVLDVRPEGAGVVVADIDLARIEQLRRQLPSVEHRTL